MIYNLLTHKQARERLNLTWWNFRKLLDMENSPLDQVDVGNVRTKISEKDINEYIERQKFLQGFAYRGKLSEYN